MAGDTRDSPLPPPGSPSGASEPPSHEQTPSKTYEVFNSPPSANALPEGSGQNTAGRHEQVPTLASVVKTIRLGDLKQVYMYPCVKDSLLFGIYGGFGVGGARAIWGTGVLKASHWAVGTFVFGSLARYEFCLYQRKLEIQQMKRVVEIIDRKKAEKEAADKAMRDERRKLKEEADKKAEEAANAKWWKLW
ncbi:hypothetical protein PZA11_004918 [Diplocarpon coronariae]|uniref:Cytochrome c oxidase assembly protein COX20, mitochondrial n=1 Tax=Diplocarpon coronariae TaxID=2795749 RepID=A0A218YRV0_9HELO|nr:hypothetical protein JHW43_002808 [Diplocarpon mali]OWO97545.1 hypothetical protein B2J93_656 [Marssonina coronariae]